MPLHEPLRQTVVSYVLKHVVPKSVRPRPITAIPWFEDRFLFIKDEELKKHLGEALYQARFAGRLQEALNLTSGFNHLFIKTQILLYASIFEAIIDYFLNLRIKDDRVASFLQETVYKEAKNAFSINTKLLLKDPTKLSETELTPCYTLTRTRNLKEIQFKKRLECATLIGLIKKEDFEFIETLYTKRNSIHLITSAARQFKPDKDQSSQAFKTLCKCINHIEKWSSQHCN